MKLQVIDHDYFNIGHCDYLRPFGFSYHMFDIFHEIVGQKSMCCVMEH